MHPTLCNAAGCEETLALTSLAGIWDSVDLVVGTWGVASQSPGGESRQTCLRATYTYQSIWPASTGGGASIINIIDAWMPHFSTLLFAKMDAWSECPLDPSNISVQRQDCSARGFLRCQFWFCSSGWWWCGSLQLTIIWNPAMMTHFSQTDVFPWPAGFCLFPGSTLFGRLLILQCAPSKPWFDSPLDPNVHLNVIHSVLSPE